MFSASMWYKQYLRLLLTLVFPSSMCIQDVKRRCMAKELFPKADPWRHVTGASVLASRQAPGTYYCHMIVFCLGEHMVTCDCICKKNVGIESIRARDVCLGALGCILVDT